MTKTIGYGLLVLAIWAVLEIQTQGTRGAFGGALAGWFAPVESARGEPALPAQPITGRVRDRVNASMGHAEERRERLGGFER